MYFRNLFKKISRTCFLKQFLLWYLFCTFVFENPYFELLGGYLLRKKAFVR